MGQSNRDKIVIGVLASGNGSNAEKIIETVSKHPTLEIGVAISDRENAYCLRRFERLGVPFRCIPREKKQEGQSIEGLRSAHEKAVLDCLEEHKVKWICLAGYMRLLSPKFLKEFQAENGKYFRVMNIHPALLPAYPGKDGYQRAYADGKKTAGVTVHLVDEGVDTGPILLQQSFERSINDTLEEFINRGKNIEHQLYPRALNMIDKEIDQMMDKI